MDDFSIDTRRGHRVAPARPEPPPITIVRDGQTHPPRPESSGSRELAGASLSFLGCLIACAGAGAWLYYVHPDNGLFYLNMASNYAIVSVLGLILAGIGGLVSRP